MPALTIYHIPVCPFSQRPNIVLMLKGMEDRGRFQVIDIAEPRPDWLVVKTGRQTPLPVLETADGSILRESLVILRYIDELWPAPMVARADPYERALERILIALEGAFTNTGYSMVLNRAPAECAAFRDRMDQHYLDISRFLEQHAPGDTFLFESFGLAEAVFTPIFFRFRCLAYYEAYEPPQTPEAEPLLRWHAACLAHPAAQQVTLREVVTLHYDDALGAGNGTLLPGRKRSSFVFEPDWRTRPLPPRDTFRPRLTDAELGLL